MISYDTLSQAVDGLKKRGYSTDFNLDENCLVCSEGRFGTEAFEIVEVHRFEGDTDPADAAIIYAIESHSGIKGVLVNGYGISSDNIDAEMVKKLSLHRN